MLKQIFPPVIRESDVVTQRKALGLLVSAGFSFDRAMDLLLPLKVARFDWRPWYYLSDVHALARAEVRP